MVQYIVQPGDTLYDIAGSHGLRLQDLYNANPGISDLIYPEQAINLPAPGAQAVSVHKAAPPQAAHDIMVTPQQFKAAVMSGGYAAPSEQQYNAFRQRAVAESGIRSRRELAMFLTQICWESTGLKDKREISPPPGAYDYGPNGQWYYGRGFIQLTWRANYSAASQALYGDDRLVLDPDLVANDDDTAWGTAFWYWRANVSHLPAVQAGHFGASTQAINGALECGNGPNTHLARRRFELYRKVLLALGVMEPAL